jgi:hypothetical protein
VATLAPASLAICTDMCPNRPASVDPVKPSGVRARRQLCAGLGAVKGAKGERARVVVDLRWRSDSPQSLRRGRGPG